MYKSMANVDTGDDPPRGMFFSWISSPGMGEYLLALRPHTHMYRPHLRAPQEGLPGPPPRPQADDDRHRRPCR